MLSRIAESLYWIGRYVERAEDTARITDVNFHHTLGMGTLPEDRARSQRQWESLLLIVGDNSRFFASNEIASDETVPHYLILDPSNPNSVVSCVARARELAGAMRHQIASEMWEAINRFYLRLQQQRDLSNGEINPHNLYRSVVEFSHLLQGVTDSTMPREEGWYFVQAGKFLERAAKTARALDVNFQVLLDDTTGAVANQLNGTELDALQIEPHRWGALMRSLSAYEAYHKLYRSAIHPQQVLEMLILSPLFPRSIRFSIGEVASALDAIAGARPIDAGPGRIGIDPAASDAERLTGRLLSQLSYSTVDDILGAGLHNSLFAVERSCREIGDCVHRQYFLARVLTPEECIF